MKVFLVLLCLLASGLVQAQTPSLKRPSLGDSIAQPVVQEGTVQVPGVSRIAIQDRAKAWFAAHFVDASNPLMLLNSQTGVFSGKGSTRVRWGNGVPDRSNRVWFVFTLEAKEGSYHYRLIDLPNQRDTTTILHGHSPTPATAHKSVQPATAPRRKAAPRRAGVSAAPIHPYEAAVQGQLAEIAKSLHTALGKATAQDW